MQDCRSQFPSHFVHVRDHQQQPLRSREGRRQRTGLESAVDCASGTAFTLHFNDEGDVTPDIGFPLGCPLIGQFGHGGGGGDRINGAYFVDAIGDIRHGFIAFERRNL